MKRKLLIVVLALTICSQLPFAYRRYRLRRLQNAIQQLATQRTPVTPSDYIDYPGVIHVHTSLGGHSTGTFAELVSAAKANGLAFVIMTEHPESDFDTAALTLNGEHGGVLFINGNEVSTSNGDRLLLTPGAANAATMSSQTTQQIADQQKGQGGLTMAAYPADSNNWAATSVDGVEIYNLFTNSRQVNPVVLFFDGLWSYRGYADLMFANFFVRPDENLRRWDQAMSTSSRKLVAIAGNDAHSNVGVSLNDASGKQLLGIKLDPYERSFRTVRTHVLIKRDRGLTRESVLEALRLGHGYVSFDLFSAADGFSFTVAGSDLLMGDDARATLNPILVVRTPLPARVVLLKNGSLAEQKSGAAVEFSPDGPGNYRVEVYLDSLPAPVTGQPWIISNPIYIR